MEGKREKEREGMLAMVKWSQLRRRDRSLVQGRSTAGVVTEERPLVQ